MMRESLEPDMLARYLEWSRTLDVTSYLPRVQAPTLVLHRSHHRLIPVRAVRAFVSLVPDARLIVLDGDDAMLFLSVEPEAMASVDRFLGEEEALPAPPIKDVVTVLFTDLTDSTALTQRLGDARAQELVRAHNAIVREALSAHSGSEIKHTGDGIMASFASASGALECAAAIQRAVDERAEELLRVHIGINAGEPVAEEQDLFGTAVQLARRICDEAEGGEVLVSDVVRQLAAGKGFLFADRGAVALRGFEDPVRLYEVRWREE